MCLKINYSIEISFKRHFWNKRFQQTTKIFMEYFTVKIPTNNINFKYRQKIVTFLTANKIYWMQIESLATTVEWWMQAVVHEASLRWYCWLLANVRTHTINYAVQYTFPAVSHYTFRCLLSLHLLSILTVRLYQFNDKLIASSVCQISENDGKCIPKVSPLQIIDCMRDLFECDKLSFKSFLKRIKKITGKIIHVEF